MKTRIRRREEVVNKEPKEEKVYNKTRIELKRRKVRKKHIYLLTKKQEIEKWEKRQKEMKNSEGGSTRKKKSKSKKSKQKIVLIEKQIEEKKE